MSKVTIARVPFAPGERYTMMWGCCGGTHQGSWQNNGNDYYAGAGTVVVAPIAGVVVRAGAPPIGQGERVGIQGDGMAVYLAHLQNLRVRVGQEVAVGQVLGEVWDFPAMPHHLHFSLAKGTYDKGTFVDPWAQVVALGIHINGRVYEAPSGLVGPGAPTPAPLLRMYVEELPMNMGGLGPAVFGPWADTPGHRRNRADLAKRMSSRGRLVAPMQSRDGSLYIFEYLPGRHGKPFRWGAWTIPANTPNARKVLGERREDAIKKLLADGRLVNPRTFTGPSNTLYPWI